MMRRVTRRRFLAISAAACVAPSAALGARPKAKWQGVALGAPASIQLSGLSAAEAAPVFEAAEAEILRLERLFSLYLPDSELSRLNRTGALSNPAPEMLELLSLSGAIHRATAGAFDPSVQPLWLAYAAVEWGAPEPAKLQAARRAVGWEGVKLSTASVEFLRPGMALTLNGIAQGYIADRVADLLRNAGLRDVLVDMGEISAHGMRPDGTSWRVGISAPDGQLLREIALTDRALATSAPQGTLLGGVGDGHILDPRAGAPADLWRVSSGSADRAAVADGLSTAFCLMSRAEVDLALRAFSNARVELLT